MNPHLDFLLSSVYDRSDLHPDHLADLQKSGLSYETITRQKFRTVTPPSLFDHLLGFQVPMGVTSMYVIPFFDTNGNLTDHVRTKVFPAITTANGTLKYLQPRRSGVRIYFPLATLQAVLHSDATLPTVSIPASRFSGMTWVTEQWGLRAIVWPEMSTRDYLRATE